jgi:hypothetical protein
MFDLKQIFNYNYVFEYLPAWNKDVSWYNWLVFGAILALGLVLWLVTKLWKKNRYFLVRLNDRVLPLTNFLGLTGLVLVFFRYQLIPFLSSRILIYLLVIISLIWFGNILRYFIKIYPIERQTAVELYRKKKYIKTRRKKKGFIS